MASLSSTILVSSFLLFPLLAQAANFNVVNQCSYTVWAAAVPGGGQQLDAGQSWTVTAPAGTTGGRIWARTGCNFDANGQGSCATGDCGGVLQCTAYGAPPDTLAEYALGQFNNLDFYDISLVDGFNVPMDFTPTSGGCHDINCSADVVGQCPAQLKLDGACGNPCTVFKTDEYCCEHACAPHPSGPHLLSALTALTEMNVELKVVAILQTAHTKPKRATMDFHVRPRNRIV